MGVLLVVPNTTTHAMGKNNPITIEITKDWIITFLVLIVYFFVS